MEDNSYKIFGAVLGDMKLTQGKRLSLAPVNRYLKRFDKHLSKSDLEDLLVMLSNKQEPLYTAYVTVASGKQTLSEYLDVDNTIYDKVSPATINNIELKESQKQFKQSLMTGAYSKMLAEKNLDAISKLLTNLDLSKFSKGVEIPDESEDVLILNLSDLHIGELDDLYVGNYHNHYNLDVMWKRLDAYVDKALSYARVRGITNIVVVNVGDIITGAYMHPNQMFGIEFDISHQVSEALDVILNLLDRLNSEFNVTFASIAGNHDRMNQKDKSGNIPSDSAAYVIMNTIKLLKDTYGVLSNVKLVDNYSDMHEVDLTINNKRIVWTHGEKVKRNNNDNSYKFQAGGKHIDCLIYGHFHTFQIKSGDLCQEVGLPALKGMDSYAKSLPTEFSAPGQCFTVVPKNGNIYSIPVLFKGDEF